MPKESGDTRGKAYCPRCLKEAGFYENRCENGHYIFEGDEEQYDFCIFCRDYTLREDGSCINGHILFNSLESIYLNFRKRRFLRPITSFIEDRYAFLVILSLIVAIYFWTIRESQIYNLTSSLILIVITTLVITYFIWMVLKLTHLWMTRRSDPEAFIRTYAVKSKEGNWVRAKSTKEYPFEKNIGKIDKLISFIMVKSKYSIFIFMGVLISLVVVFVWLPHRDKVQQQKNVMEEATQEQERYVAIPYEIETEANSIQENIDTFLALDDGIYNHEIDIMKIAKKLQAILNERDVDTYRFYSENSVDFQFDIILNQVQLSLSDGVYPYFQDDAVTVRYANERIEELEAICENTINAIEEACGEITLLYEESKSISGLEGHSDPRYAIWKNIEKLQIYIEEMRTFIPTNPYWEMVKQFYDEWVTMLSSGSLTTSQMESLYERINQVYWDNHDLLVKNIWIEQSKQGPFIPLDEQITEEDLDGIFTEIFEALEVLKEVSN